MGYLDGFGVTLKKLFGPGTESGRRVTSQYPEQTRPKPERFHGRHVLNRYDDGMEKCIGCELCAGVCPAQCIYVRGADNDPDDPTSPGERFGFIYEINYLRCIHCDLCVEACPTEAITETKLFEFAFTNRADAIYTKDELVVDDEGRPQQLPWENWDGGFDPAADTSGWMRATAPSGDADFVGIVAWAGELGYGVRAPQGGGTVTTETVAELTEPLTDEPGIVEPATEAEPVAMAGGTEEAVIFDAPDEERGRTVSDASPLLVDAVPESVDVDVEDDQDTAPTTSSTQQTAGLFDAPDADAPATSARRPFGRRRTKRDAGTSPATAASATPAADEEDLLRPKAAGSSTEDTSVEDAAIVAALDGAPDAPAPEAEPEPRSEPADASEPTDEAADDATDEAADDATDEAADDVTDDATGDGPEPDAPSPPPTAGFFDAPDEPEPPKGRKGRRRRGGR